MEREYDSDRSVTFRELWEDYGVYGIARGWPSAISRPWRIAFLCAFPVTFPVYLAALLLVLPFSFVWLVVRLTFVGIRDFIEGW